MGKVTEKVYCAFCKIKRKAYTKKHINWTNVLLSIFLASLSMIVLWQTFNPKVFILFITFLSLSEVFIQIRWRLSMACPHCGFDPVVYVRDPTKAAKRVKDVLDRKKASPDIWLKSKNPFELLSHRTETNAPVEIRPKKSEQESQL